MNPVQRTTAEAHIVSALRSILLLSGWIQLKSTCPCRLARQCLILRSSQRSAVSGLRRGHRVLWLADVVVERAEVLQRSAVTERVLVLHTFRQLLHSLSPNVRHSGGARVFAARGKRLCCRPRQSDRQLNELILLWLQR